MSIRVNVDPASSLKAHMLGPENLLLFSPTSSLRVNSGRYPSLGSDIQTNLAGYWPLAYKGAIDLNDYSGNANHLTNTDDAIATAGPNTGIPYAALFDGVSQLLSVTDDAALEPGAQDFALAFWARVDTTATTQHLAGKDSTAGGGRSYRALVNSGDDLQGQLSADGTATANNTDGDIATDGEWHYCVLTYDNSTGVFSVRLDLGTASETTPALASIADTATAFTIGATGANGGGGGELTTFGVGEFNNVTPSGTTRDFSNPLGTLIWADLEPTENNYDLSPIEAALVAADGEGKKAMPRIASANLSSQPIQATPDWVFDTAGVASYLAGSTRNPIPWDTTYQTLYNELLQAIAAVYDGDPRIEFIPCTMGGIFGEMTFAGNNPPGYSIANHANAINFHIDAWELHFPNTPKSAMINSWAGADPADDDAFDKIVNLSWILQTNNPTANSIVRAWFNSADLTNKICIEAEWGAGVDDDVLPGFQTKWEDMLTRWDAMDYVTFHADSFSDAPTASYIEDTVKPALRTNGPQPSGVS